MLPLEGVLTIAPEDLKCFVMQGKSFWGQPPEGFFAGPLHGAEWPRVCSLIICKETVNFRSSVYELSRREFQEGDAIPCLTNVARISR